MKAIFCLFISVLTFICPYSKTLKKYCSKLAETAYVIAEPNENNRGSIAVQAISFDKKK